MLHKLRRMFQQARDERGFTLVELLMVMVIIGVLAGLGFTGFNALQTRAAKAKADVYWRDLNSAIAMLRVEGEFPADGIEVGNSTAGNFEDVLDGYLDFEDASAPWGAASDVTEGANYQESPGSGVEFLIVDERTVCVWVDGVGASNNDEDECKSGETD